MASEVKLNLSELLRNGRFYYFVLIALFGAFFGTSGGGYLWLNHLAPGQLEALARQDPFRGADAKELRDELRQDIATLHIKIIELQATVDNLPPREFQDRMLSLEHDLIALQRELERHSH